MGRVDIFYQKEERVKERREGEKEERGGKKRKIERDREKSRVSEHDFEPCYIT